MNLLNTNTISSIDLDKNYENDNNNISDLKLTRPK